MGPVLRLVAFMLRLAIIGDFRGLVETFGKVSARRRDMNATLVSYRLR